MIQCYQQAAPGRMRQALAQRNPLTQSLGSSAQQAMCADHPAQLLPLTTAGTSTSVPLGGSHRLL